MPIVDPRYKPSSVRNSGRFAAYHATSNLARFPERSDAMMQTENSIALVAAVPGLPGPDPIMDRKGEMVA
jgi:hypothetical protein